jgi:hypothetical protein
MRRGQHDFECRGKGFGQFTLHAPDQMQAFVQDGMQTAIRAVKNNGIGAQIGRVGKRDADQPVIEAELRGNAFSDMMDEHVVDRTDDGTCLLYIDRHLVHEVTSPQAFEGLRMAGRKVRQAGGRRWPWRPQRADLPTARFRIKEEESRIQVETLSKNCAEFGVSCST